MTGALGGWTEMLAAFGAFFASHMIPARPQIRAWLRARLGAGLYIALYSAISLALVGWLIVAAGRAPYVELWAFAPWQLWAPNIAMPLACLLIGLGAGTINPFSFAGRAPEKFDPANPGIAGLIRYPILWAIVLWALAHMVPNGDLAHVLLFGLFAGFGLAGMAMLDSRRRRQWGEDVWAARAANTSLIPLAAILAGRARLGPALWRPGRIAAGIAVYLMLLLGHRAVIGVSPLPLW
ncbi:MAG: NnrU family protein [Dichotomicrobium sp.]